MKKLLGIIVLGLMLSGNAYSAITRCKDDLDISWEYGPGKQYMLWTIKNTSDLNIVITEIALKSRSKVLDI